MDTITHGIVGALAGKALFAGRTFPPALPAKRRGRALSSPTARAAIVACTLGSMFPDIDIFAGPLAHNPLAIMEWHRNITHSAVMLPLWALLLAAVSIPLARLLKWKSPPFLTLFAIYAVGIATHIFLDLVTNFGTMVWSPLRYSRPAWDWVFILDLTLTSIALVPQFAAWCYREPGQFWRRADERLGRAHRRSIRSLSIRVHLGIRISDRGCRCRERHFRGRDFPAGRSGRRFPVDAGKLVPRGPGVLCAYIGLAAAAHHKALADVKRFADAQALASGEPGGASSAADADALGWARQHSGGRVAHHFSRARRRRREHATLYRRADPSESDRASEEAARCAGLSLVRPISRLARAAAGRTCRP